MPVDRYALDRQVPAEITDAALLRHAHDMIWIAEFQPSEVGRETFGTRRDMAVAEIERRDLSADAIRAELREAGNG